MKRVTKTCSRKYMLSRPNMVPNDKLDLYYDEQVNIFMSDIMNDIIDDNSGLNPDITDKKIELISSMYTARNYLITISYEVDEEDTNSEIMSEELVNLSDMNNYVHEVLGK